MSLDEELNYLNDIPIIPKNGLLRLSSGGSYSNSSNSEHSFRLTEETRKPTFPTEKDTKKEIYTSTILVIV